MGFCVRWILGLFASAIFLAACCSLQTTPSLQRFEFNSSHMGTRFSITLFDAEKGTAESAAQAAFLRIAKLDDILSDYKADSELTRLSESPVNQPVAISEDLFNVLEQSEKYSKLTDGAFDVTVGPLVRLWRFSRKRKILPDPREIERAQQGVGYGKLRLDRQSMTATLLAPNMRLDAGGIGKGYAADQALVVLKKRGITRALVAASGDIAVGDPPPGERGWRVAVASMDSSTNETGLVLRNCGISTSGDIEQFVEINGVRYSHIVDPVTGLGLTNRIQATIVAPNATTTDALDTGVSVLGPQRGLKLVDSLPHTAAIIFVKKGEQKKMFMSRRFKELENKSRVTP